MRAKRQQHIPIDHGYAWVILVCACFGVALESTPFVSAMYFTFFQEHYQGSISAIALVFALQASFSYLMGPFSSLLMAYIGFRLTVMVGTVLAVAGYVCSAFAPSLEILLITFGCMVGIGLGIAWSPAVVLMGFYFDKHRNLVYGIVATATGIGMVVFTLMIKLFQDYYGFEGSLIMIGGVVSHMLIIASLLRPVTLDTEDRENHLKGLKQEIQAEHMERPCRFVACQMSLTSSFVAREPPKKPSHSVSPGPIKVDVTGLQPFRPTNIITEVIEESENESKPSHSIIMSEDSFQHKLNSVEGKKGIKSVKHINTVTEADTEAKENGEPDEKANTGDANIETKNVTANKNNNKLFQENVPQDDTDETKDITGNKNNNKLFQENVPQDHTDEIQNLQIDAENDKVVYFHEQLVQETNNRMPQQELIPETEQSTDTRNDLQNLKSSQQTAVPLILPHFIEKNDKKQSESEACKQTDKSAAGCRNASEQISYSFQQKYSSKPPPDSENPAEHLDAQKQPQKETKAYNSLSNLSSQYLALTVMAMEISNSLLIRSRTTELPVSDTTKSQAKVGLCTKLYQSFKPILTMRFCCVLLNLFVMHLCISLVYVHLPAYAMEVTPAENQAVRLYSAIGIANVISKFLTGVTTNLHGLDLFVLLSGSVGFTAVVLTLVPMHAGSDTMNILFALGFAFYSNCFFVLQSPLTINILGTEHMSTSYGLQLFFAGTGYLLGAPLGGLVIEALGSYVSSYSIGGLVYFLAWFVIMTVMLCSNVVNKDRENCTETEQTSARKTTK